MSSGILDFKSILSSTLYSKSLNFLKAKSISDISTLDKNPKFPMLIPKIGTSIFPLIPLATLNIVPSPPRTIIRSNES